MSLQAQEPPPPCRCPKIQGRFDPVLFLNTGDEGELPTVDDTWIYDGYGAEGEAGLYCVKLNFRIGNTTGNCPIIGYDIKIEGMDQFLTCSSTNMSDYIGKCPVDPNSPITQLQGMQKLPSETFRFNSSIPVGGKSLECLSFCGLFHDFRDCLGRKLKITIAPIFAGNIIRPECRSCFWVKKTTKSNFVYDKSCCCTDGTCICYTGGGSGGSTKIGVQESEPANHAARNVRDIAVDIRNDAVAGVCRVTASLPDALRAVRVIAVDGSTVISRAIESGDHYEFSIADLPAGVDVVNVTDLEGNTYSRKILVNGD